MLTKEQAEAAGSALTQGGIRPADVPPRNPFVLPALAIGGAAVTAALGHYTGYRIGGLMFAALMVFMFAWHTKRK